MINDQVVIAATNQIVSRGSSSAGRLQPRVGLGSPASPCARVRSPIALHARGTFIKHGCEIEAFVSAPSLSVVSATGSFRSFRSGRARRLAGQGCPAHVRARRQRLVPRLRSSLSMRRSRLEPRPWRGHPRARLTTQRVANAGGTRCGLLVAIRRAEVAGPALISARAPDPSLSGLVSTASHQIRSGPPRAGLGHVAQSASQLRPLPGPDGTAHLLAAQHRTGHPPPPTARRGHRLAETGRDRACRAPIVAVQNPADSSPPGSPHSETATRTVPGPASAGSEGNPNPGQGRPGRRRRRRACSCYTRVEEPH